MSDQLSYLNNLNRASLVDLSLLQKINEGYHNSPPKMSYIFSMIQTAGSKTCSLAKDNLFITVVITCLILFLMWCYIEKQRQNAMYENYLQKKLARSLLSDELNLFTETPNPINIEKLFVDINDTIAIENNIPIETPEPETPEENTPQENTQVNYIQVEKPNSPPVHLTKREQNLKIYDSNQRKPELLMPNVNEPMAGNVVSNRFMSINDYNGSYMLM